jgi:AdoMet-dependent rRNA methyltransferase SPB1
MARKMKGPVTEPASDPNDEDEDEEDDEEGGSDAEADDGEKSESDDDSDSSDYDVHKDFKDKSQGSTDEGPAAAGKVRGKKRSLTAEALALGSMMIHSKKAKRDITDDFWSRYVSNDDNLPDWFVEDERRHYRKELPITKVRTRTWGANVICGVLQLCCVLCVE